MAKRKRKWPSQSRKKRARRASASARRRHMTKVNGRNARRSKSWFRIV